MILIRAPHEIEAIGRACRVVRDTLDRLVLSCVPGATPRALDALARHLLAQGGARPLFEGVVRDASPPFPAVICVCVNDQVTHGVPGDRAFESGDLVSLDLGASLDAWCGDASRATVVGESTPGVPQGGERRTLVELARAATDAAIATMGPDVRWSDAADAARRVVEGGGAMIAPGFAGHGIGRSLHEAPRLPFYPGPKEDFILRPGMVVTVEPIVVRPRTPGVMPALVGGADGWTVTTADGSDACQIEHTVAMTRAGVRVLTGEA